MVKPILDYMELLLSVNPTSCHIALPRHVVGIAPVGPTAFQVGSKGRSTYGHSTENAWEIGKYLGMHWVSLVTY